MSTTKHEVHWVGDAPTRCDWNTRHKITKTFVDGRTRRSGSWANMCLDCHREHGIGLGIGRGQQYQKQLGGRWLKIAG